MTGGLYSSSNAKGLPPSADDVATGTGPAQPGAVYGSSTSARPGAVYGSQARAGGVYGSAAHGQPGAVYGPATAAQPGAPLLEEESLPPQEVPSGGGGGLLRSSAIMAIGTLASRITGFLRSTLLIAALGTVALGDVFNTANTIPNIVFDILLGGVLTAAHVPLLVRARAKSERYGEEFEQRLFTVLLGALAAITAVAMLASPLLISLYAQEFGPEQRSVAQLFLLFFLPQIFFYGFAAVAGASLNSRGRFGAPMWTPVLNNVVVVGVTAAFMIMTRGDDLTPKTITNGQVAFLGIGVTLGVAAQAIGLIPSMRRLGISFRPRFDFRRDELTQMWGMAGWTLVYVIAQQVALVVYTNLANAAGHRYEQQHPDGAGVGLTPWATAYAFFQLPYAVVAISIITAILPRMTQSAAEGNLGRLATELREGVRLAMALMLPAVALLFGAASEIAYVLFAHGNSTPADAEVIAQVLRVFAVALVPFAFLQLLQRGFYAISDTRTPGLIAIGSAAAGAISAFVLSTVLATEHVVLGVAAAQGISWTIGGVVSVVLLRKKVGRLGGRSILALMLRAGAAALVTLAVAQLAHLVVAPHLGDSFVLQALLLAGVGVVGGGAYVIAASLLRVSEVNQVVGMLRRRIGR